MEPGRHSSFTKMKGPEPTALEICADAGVLATASGMTNSALESGLASASSTRPNGSRSAKVKVRSSTASSFGAGREQGLADDVAVLPAQDRGHGVGGPHRAAVMEFQATAQAEHPGLAVVGDLPGVDHLRLRLAARIEGEELIVDEIAVIGRVGRGVEHRVDAAHVDGEDDLEHLRRPTAPDGWR